MSLDYGPLIQAETSSIEQVCEDEADGFASGALILMAVMAWAEDNDRDPTGFAAGIVDRAEAIAARIHSLDV